MARADAARTNSSEDIPLAKRSTPFRRPSRRDVRFLLILTIALIVTVGSVAIRSNFFGPLMVQPPPLVNGGIPSADGRLLGHFPYPEASSQDLVSVYRGLEIHKDTFGSFRTMQSAAAKDGIDLILLSAYRSHALQEEIFFQIKSSRNQTAVERAKVSAPPGYSEHSTGYAIDIGDKMRPETDFVEGFENTRAFRWLEKNAARYHFVLSFPKGNAQGVTYEPWHWRFEGTADALRQFEAARRLEK